MKTDIIAICGPTGIGKTGFAIALANRFHGEIVGADSMQIYRYMDIGTAKPTEEERRLAPHHLIDFVDPDRWFDAAAFVRRADRAITDISGRHRLPIIAGGTGLYIRALIHGLFKNHTVDPRVMRRLEVEARDMGGQVLYDRLSVADPVAAGRIHPNDTFRLVRALAVLETTGRPISRFHQAHGFSKKRYNALKIMLHMKRTDLYDRIDRRVEQMLAAGLETEVHNLIDRGYDCGLKSMQSIGYRHVCDFFFGRTDREEMVRLMKRDTRRYAKRQLTWFRKETGMVWLSPNEIDRACELVDIFLTERPNDP